MGQDAWDGMGMATRDEGGGDNGMGQDDNQQQGMMHGGGAQTTGCMGWDGHQQGRWMEQNSFKITFFQYDSQTYFRIVYEFCTFLFFKHP